MPSVKRAHTLIPLTFTHADCPFPCSTRFFPDFAVQYFKESSGPYGIWVPSGWLPYAGFKGETARHSCPRGGCLCWAGMSVGDLSQGAEGGRELCSHPCQYYFVKQKKNLWLGQDWHVYLKSDLLLRCWCFISSVHLGFRTYFGLSLSLGSAMSQCYIHCSEPLKQLVWRWYIYLR